MSELPDLEILAENLNKRFRNRVLEQVEIKLAKSLNVSVAELKANIEGQELKSLARNGLVIMLQFKNHAVLTLDLKASGKLQALKHEDVPELNQINLYFKGGEVLAVNHPQDLSVFKLNPIYTVVPDALDKEMTFEYLSTVLLENTKQIKSVLLDQKVLRGIGQAYADEILWYAEISPFSIAGKIPATQVKKLHKTIKYVLLDAIKHLKKLDPEQVNAEMHDFLLIHNPGKEKSPTGRAIKTKSKAGILTYYTDEQVLWN
jgi:formamidopyrimidine-DNA glycosylase